MASSRLDMPSTLIVLDKNSSPIQLNGDEMGDGHNKRTLSRSSAGSRVSDLDPDSVKRTPTPSKQVSLTSVRRKDDINENLQKRSYTPPADSSRRFNGFYGDVHAVSTRLNQPLSPGESASPDPNSKLQLHVNSTESDTQSTSNKKEVSNIKEANNDLSDGTLAGEKDDSDEEDKAPSQLLMEFLGCVMEEDYQNAQKLCKMILLFEPEHPEALKFQPLIEEKLKQEEEDSENSDDDTSSEDDDEDDDDDSSDDSNQSSSDEEDDETETDQSKGDV